MLIEGKFSLKAPIQKVWDHILQPEILGSCLPGAEKVAKVDETTYDAVVKQKVGPIKVTLEVPQCAHQGGAPESPGTRRRGRGHHEIGSFQTENRGGPQGDRERRGGGLIPGQCQHRGKTRHVRRPDHEEQGQRRGKRVYPQPPGKTKVPDLIGQGVIVAVILAGAGLKPAPTKHNPREMQCPRKAKSPVDTW